MAATSDDRWQVNVGTVTMPLLGFGTWQLSPEDARRGVEVALANGYRHVDTAQAYCNEDAVGAAIAASGLDRDEVFVTTKVAREHTAPADVVSSTEESLDRLGLDHIDLLLTHWPVEDLAPIEATLEAMTGLQERGLTRAIGVSNYPSRELARALEVAPVITDQVEHHPYLAVDAIRGVLGHAGGVLTAYSPIAQARVVDDPLLQRIGTTHGVGPVQVTLRWHLQRGVAAIPRSRNPERIVANAAVFDFSLSDDELAAIDSLARGERLLDPDWAPEWDD